MLKRYSLRAATAAAAVAAALSVAVPALAAETLRPPAKPVPTVGQSPVVLGEQQNNTVQTGMADWPSGNVTALLTDSTRMFAASSVRRPTTGTTKPGDVTIAPAGRIAAKSVSYGWGGLPSPSPTTTTKPPAATIAPAGRIAAKSVSYGWGGLPSPCPTTTTKPPAATIAPAGRIAAKSLAVGGSGPSTRSAA